MFKQPIKLKSSFPKGTQGLRVNVIKGSNDIDKNGDTGAKMCPVTINIDDMTVLTLVDHGADLSIISKGTCEKLDKANCLTISIGKEQTLVGVTGNGIKVVKFVKIKYQIGSSYYL